MTIPWPFCSFIAWLKLRGDIHDEKSTSGGDEEQECRGNFCAWVSARARECNDGDEAGLSVRIHGPWPSTPSSSVPPPCPRISNWILALLGFQPIDPHFTFQKYCCTFKSRNEHPNFPPGGPPVPPAELSWAARVAPRRILRSFASPTERCPRGGGGQGGGGQATRGWREGDAQLEHAGIHAGELGESGRSSGCCLGLQGSRQSAVHCHKRKDSTAGGISGHDGGIFHIHAGVGGRSRNSCW